MTHWLFKIKREFYSIQKWNAKQSYRLIGSKKWKCELWSGFFLSWNMSTNNKNVSDLGAKFSCTFCFSYLVFMSNFVKWTFLHSKNMIVLPWVCHLFYIICYCCAFDYPTNSMKHENWPVSFLSTYTYTFLLAFCTFPQRTSIKSTNRIHKIGVCVKSFAILFFKLIFHNHWIKS